MKRTPRSSPRSAKPQRTVSIIGTGSYVPEKRLTNDDLCKSVDTDDEWITTRTGIKERRIAADDEYTSDMGAKAALAAMEQAGITAEEIDLILVATATPDMVFPRQPVLSRQRSGRIVPPVSTSRQPAPAFFSRSKSRSNLSPATPTTPCL